MQPLSRPFLYLSVKRQRFIVESVCKRLEKAYGKPRLGNPTDPLDDLIFIILSNRTGRVVASRVYEELRAAVGGDWQRLLVGSADFRRILRPAGLANKRTAHLRAVISHVEEDFGAEGIAVLRRRSAEDSQAYLTSLPGVSDKVAKCVMMYTLGFDVLPVDAHVHRIARRLGWTTRKRADQCHKELESFVPPLKRFAFHVDCIEHGRKICTAQSPLCESCVVNRFCEYYRSGHEKTKTNRD